jgi:T-complex protein 1 subunit beta
MQDSHIVYGGGCSEVLMAKAVDEKAAITPGKKSLAIEVRSFLHCLILPLFFS